MLKTTIPGQDVVMVISTNLRGLRLKVGAVVSITPAAHAEHPQGYAQNQADFQEGGECIVC